VDLKTAVLEFIQENFFVSGPLGHDESLLDTGVIDSTGVLEVISFVESKFDIQVLDEEILPENLDSISRIAAFVERKRASGAECRQTS
jgi:acyl carrier protein